MKETDNMTQEITTQVRFWGGLDTIGGNIVSLEAGNYRILTDFGALFGASLEELKQVDLTPSLLEKGHLPAIDGLYTRQQLGASDLASYEETDMKTIVCLSHLHLDHIGGFGQLPEDLPIYALEDSVSFYQLSVWLRRPWTLSSNAQECLWFWTLSWSARKHTT
ncbi:MAG: MBL fold metallo-hydrolase [Abiotrophia defectiva]